MTCLFYNGQLEENFYISNQHLVLLDNELRQERLHIDCILEIQATLLSENLKGIDSIGCLGLHGILLK